MSSCAEDTIMASTALPHDEAVTAFVEGVETADISALQRLVLFGSVARSTHGSDSDIDISRCSTMAPTRSASRSN